MKKFLALASEARGTIRHDTLALCRTDLRAEVGLAGEAEFAFTALRDIKRDHVVSHFNRGNTLSHTLHNTCTFVSQDNGECALRICSLC